MKLFAIILSILVSLSVQAEDDCVRAFPKPIVQTDSKRVTNYSILVTDKRNIEERFTLDKTKIIKIKQYGCAHFGIEYSKIIKKQPAKTKSILKQSLTFIEELKGVAYYQLQAAENAIIKTIKNNDWKPEEPITVTKGYEWVVVDSTKDKAGKLLLTVTIDIAL